MADGSSNYDYLFKVSLFQSAEVAWSEADTRRSSLSVIPVLVNRAYRALRSGHGV